MATLYLPELMYVDDAFQAGMRRLRRVLGFRLGRIARRRSTCSKMRGSLITICG